MRLGAIALVAIVGLAACAKKESALARLEQASGPVERAPQGDAWAPAKLDDPFVLGSGVRTGDAAKAKLRLRRGGSLELGANTVLRFASHPGRDDGDVKVESGTAELEAGDGSIGFGNATLEPGGRAHLTAGANGVTIGVVVGRAVLENGTTIGAGGSFTIQIGGAIIEEAPKPDAAPPADAPAIDAAPPPATSIKIEVKGKKARSEEGGQWKPLAAGEHEVAPDAHLDAQAGTSLGIAAAGGSIGATGPLDLKLGGDTGVALTMTAGSLTAFATAGDIAVAVPGGVTTSKTGSELAMRIRPKNGGTELEMRQGEGSVHTDKADETLHVGDFAVLMPDGTIVFQSRAPATAVFSIPAGESATIHDRLAPTALGVRFGGACGSDGLVEVAKDRGFARVIARSGGKGSANVLVPPGSYTYRLKCEGKVARTGSIGVLKDAGSRALPKAAPRTLVEADGREYVITYQNLLPQLTLSWSSAPARTSYNFVVQPATGDAKRFTNPTPRLTLKSGDVGEGSYKYWVEIPETGGRSDVTKIVIDFDNAAASASIEKVEKKAPAVHVRGQALEGTTVTSADQPIALDAHHRFEADLLPRAGDDGVAVRIAHPKLGVHYYVLRPK